MTNSISYPDYYDDIRGSESSVEHNLRTIGRLWTHYPPFLVFVL